PVHPAGGARREGGPRALQGLADGSRQGRDAGSLRSLDRRARVAYPRRHRGRSQETAPHPHGPRGGLRLRPAAGLMHRLYLRIYLAVLASLAAFALVSGFLWRQLGAAGPAGHAFEVAGPLAQNVLPPAGAPGAEQQAALEKIAANLKADVALFAADRPRLGPLGGVAA